MNLHFSQDAQDVLRNLGAQVVRFSGKRILLTGAAGFLGSQFVHFFQALNDSGALPVACALHAWDNFSRGTPDWLERLRSRADLVIEKRDAAQSLLESHYDFILHAASIASPVFYRRHPLATMDANVNGLRFLLEHAVKAPPESMVFFSSSEIYGDPDPLHIPTEETYRGNVSCTGPRSCYDESKRYGETLSVNFWRMHRVPIKIVRPFNNYGPGLKISDRRVISDFFRNVLAREDIVLLSDGRATRTFCYTSDALTGYLLALLSECHGEPFNIGVEQPEVTMMQLAEMVIRISGKKLAARHARSEDPDYLSDNPQRRCPSIEKARKLLGYKPRIALEEGLARTYAYYQDHPVAADA